MEQNSQYGQLPSGDKQVGHNASPPVAYKGQELPAMVRKTFDPSSKESAQMPKTASGK